MQDLLVHTLVQFILKRRADYPRHMSIKRSELNIVAYHSLGVESLRHMTVKNLETVASMVNGSYEKARVQFN